MQQGKAAGDLHLRPYDKTVGDLYRAGISTKADFDMAVGDALLAIAPEDLPNARH